MGRADGRASGVAEPGHVVVKAGVTDGHDLPFAVQALVPDLGVIRFIGLDDPFRCVVQKLQLLVFFYPQDLFDPGEGGNIGLVDFDPHDIFTHVQNLAFLLMHRGQENGQIVRSVHTDVELYLFAFFNLDVSIFVLKLLFDLVSRFVLRDAVNKGQLFYLLPGFIFHSDDESELRKVITDAAAAVGELFLLIFVDGSGELNDPFLVLSICHRLQVLRDCRRLSLDVDLVAVDLYLRLCKSNRRNSKKEDSYY